MYRDRAVVKRIYIYTESRKVDTCVCVCVCVCDAKGAIKIKKLQKYTRSLKRVYFFFTPPKRQNHLEEKKKLVSWTNEIKRQLEKEKHKTETTTLYE